MDKLNRYRDTIKQVIEDYAGWFPRNEEVQTEIVVDADHDHYELIRVGWKDECRVHHSVIHFDIVNGKIWIQQDSTNRPVADALLEAGIPREDIVLGFQPPETRRYAEFAAA